MVVSIGEAMATVGEYMDQFGYNKVSQLTSEDLDILSDMIQVPMTVIARLLCLRDFE